MTIEQTLERIAAALEKLADSKNPNVGGVNVMDDAPAKQQQMQRTRPGKKVEEPVQTEDQMNEPDPSADIPAVDIKFADLNKAWFNMLGEIKNAQGLPAAQGVAQELMDKYCGGKRFGESAIDKSEYAAFMADINKETEAVSG